MIKRFFISLSVVFLATLLLGAGSQRPDDLSDQVRGYTRDNEFDFADWTLDAIGVKLRQMAVGSQNYLDNKQRHQMVLDYLQLVWQIQVGEAELEQVYSDPNIADPATASELLRAQLSKLRAQRKQIAPLVEAILQEQISNIASEMGLTLGGQPIPPVLYHATELPWALIVSPRTEIRQEANIDLSPDLTLEQQVALENQVDKRLDVSSLVVGIGGIGLYPTMVKETANLNWLSEVVAHEWVHNFLTLRPLGLSYMNSPQLRTMNETAASIAGKEIGRAVIERYYPEFAPPETPSKPDSGAPNAPPDDEPPPFDFNAEMRETRVEVDRLLAEGKVDEAEAYMEARRIFFWENGYQIRKLNQAWFAFHGAYADQPGGGAAGTDPVGAAVRALRAQSPSLAAFLKRISWMYTFEQLQQAVEESGNTS